MQELNQAIKNIIKDIVCSEVDENEAMLNEEYNSGNCAGAVEMANQIMSFEDGLTAIITDQPITNEQWQEIQQLVYEALLNTLTIDTSYGFTAKELAQVLVALNMYSIVQ